MIKGNYYEVTGPFKEKSMGKSFYLIEQVESLTLPSDFVDGKELVSVEDFKANMLDKDSGWEELKTCNYGGLLFDLDKLPIGQRFYVNNGNWYGEVMLQNGVKGVNIDGGHGFHPSIVGQVPELYISLIYKKS
jgi:hypothetical protein